MPPRLLVVLAALLLSSACRGPALATQPWELARAGTWGVGLSPALFTIYGIDGEFETRDFVSGDTLVNRDDGNIAGRFGAALHGEYFLTDRLVLLGGLDYRVYDIENLTPTPELATEVDRIDSLQYFGALRYLFPPLDCAPRIRPFGQASLAWLPGVDVGFEVDLSEYGSSNLEIETRGDGYWVGGVAGGILYQWRDHWVVELGLLYEIPITPLEADLGFEIGPSHVPLNGEFEPAGFVGFCGLSWYF